MKRSHSAFYDLDERHGDHQVRYSARASHAVMLATFLQPACKPHTPFARIAAHARYAQVTMWTARVLSQSMVLEHMKEDDESRVREHGRVLSTTPTKPTSVGTFILSLRGRGFAAAQCLAAPVCACGSRVCGEGPCAACRCGGGRRSTRPSVPVQGPAGRRRRQRAAAIWCSVGVAFASCSVS